jgi:hypothetical protein
MVRGSTYAVHSGSWSSFLTLCSDGTILDTISTYGSECGTYGHTITLYDSTFHVIEAICRGNSGTGGTEVYCVVDGEFKLAAAFHSNGNVAVNQLRGDNDGYHVGYEFRRRPYRLNLTESFRLSPEEAGRPDHREHYKPSHWERHYQLRFDTTDHFFYSDSIRVADVWLPGEKRTLDGTFPGFALVYGSYIHTDNDWYDFQNDLFDEEESFVSGRMKPQKVIHRESDDTLRQR